MNLYLLDVMYDRNAGRNDECLWGGGKQMPSTENTNLSLFTAGETAV